MGRQLAEVVRIDADSATVKSFETTFVAGLGDSVARRPLRLAPTRLERPRHQRLGRAHRRRGTAARGDQTVAVDRRPPPAMRRGRVAEPLRTGVRVIDLFTPLCAGQRIGIFAGSGVGKSTLLAMLAARRISTRW